MAVQLRTYPFGPSGARDGHLSHAVPFAENSITEGYGEDVIDVPFMACYLIQEP